ncbi:MAG: regulatory protein RecX [Chloroflexota bacterium]|nr:MAG: regulatory protein RecX [Chloroflexota bacterium]
MRDFPDSAPELRARALRLLARREHSRAELARKLAGHAESPGALEQLLDALAAAKQLCDERYAEERARQLGRKYGAARIRLDLIAKGVAADTAARLATASADADLERARAILARKYRTPAGSAAERARRARFLQGRGFGHEIIRRLLSSSETE